MTDEQRNALNYLMLAVAAFAIGCATALIPQLMDPAMPALNFRIVLGSGLASAIATYGGSLLPRRGSANLAADVNALAEAGVPKSEMTVVPKARAKA